MLTTDYRRIWNFSEKQMIADYPALPYPAKCDKYYHYRGIIYGVRYGKSVGYTQEYVVSLPDIGVIIADNYNQMENKILEMFKAKLYKKLLNKEGPLLRVVNSKTCREGCRVLINCSSFIKHDGKTGTVARIHHTGADVQLDDGVMFFFMFDKKEMLHI